jgi:hypothetical protein
MQQLKGDPVTSHHLQEAISVHLVGETAYLLGEYGLHYDINGKRHVCLNDVFSFRRNPMLSSGDW